MRWNILAIGKPKLDFARQGVEEYVRRLRPVCDLRIDYLKAGARAEESAALLKRSESLFRVVLDEAGEEVSSRELADRIGRWEVARFKGVALLVGGAEGHADDLKQKAGWTWSLSRLTFQHELALVLVLEQLYRAFSIKAGLPYHRD